MDNTPEKRCCDECGRTGTDGGSTSESYCGACGATVPYPDEDLCPACGAANCMLIACPECGGRYSLDDEQDGDIETPNVEVQRDSGSIIAGGSAGTTGSASLAGTEDEKDAARYRWLKTATKEQLLLWRGAWGCSDVAIDDAML